MSVSDADVERIAARVAELVGDARPADEPEWVAADAIAKTFGVSRAWVYANADALGALRIGHGQNGRIRFDPRQVRERIEAIGTPAPSGSRGGCPPRLPRNRACAGHTRLFGTTGCQPRRRPLSTTSIYPHSSANCSWVEATISSCARRCSSTSDASPRSAKNRGRRALSTCGMWLSAHRDLRPE